MFSDLNKRIAFSKEHPKLWRLYLNVSRLRHVKDLFYRKVWADLKDDMYYPSDMFILLNQFTKDGKLYLHYIPKPFIRYGDRGFGDHRKKVVGI